MTALTADLVLTVCTAVRVGLLAFAVVMGLKVLFGKNEPRENVRLSRIQNVVRYLGKHGKVRRVL